MVSAMLLSDLVQGKTNPFAEVFSPSRTVLRPQLVVNGFEAAVGLLAPTTKRCPIWLRAEMEFPGAHLGLPMPWLPLYEKENASIIRPQAI